MDLDSVLTQLSIGWRDAEDGGAPLVYVLLLKRCRQSYCENFCIYIPHDIST